MDSIIRSKSKYFIITLGIGLFLGSLFLLSIFQAKTGNDADSRWFNLPQRVGFDTSNNLIYVFNSANFITILDARDYSLVQKIEIEQSSDFYIDNSSKKIYIAEAGLANRLFILDLLDKDTLSRLSSKEILQKGTLINLSVDTRPAKVFVNHEKQEVYLLTAGLKRGLSVINSKNNEIIKDIIFDFDIYYSFKAEYDIKRNKICLLLRENSDLLIIDPLQDKVGKSIGGKSNWLDFTFNDKTGEIYAITSDNLFAVINSKTEQVSFTASLGKIPRHIFYDSFLDKILITSWASHDLTIINTSSFQIEKIISLEKGAGPEFLAVSPNQNKIYVMNSGANNFSVIDANSLEVQETLPAPSHPMRALVINPITQDVVMPSSWSFTNALFVIKPDNQTTFIPPPEGDPFLTGFLDNIWKIFVHKDKGNIYVLNNIGKFSKITALDPKTHQILWTAPVGQNTRDLIIDYQRNQLYVMTSGEDLVSAIDEKSGKLIKSISVGDKPIAIIANDDFTKIYTANLADDTVSVIDPKINEVVKTISVGRAPSDLLYNKKDNLLFIWNGGSKSVTIINGNNEVISTVNLPSEIPGTSAYFVGSPELGKVYLIDFSGNIYSVYKEGEGFKTGFIKAEHNKQINDAILNEEGDKIYMIDGNQKAVDVLDLQKETIKTIFNLTQPEHFAYLLSGGSYIFSMIRGGQIRVINSQSDTLEDNIFINKEDGKKLPLPYSRWFFNFMESGSIRGSGVTSMGKGVYSEKDQKIYFPATGPDWRAIAVFDVSRKSIIDVLTYDNLTTRKVNWNIIIGGLIILAVIVGLIILIRLIRRKKSMAAVPL